MDVTVNLQNLQALWVGGQLWLKNALSVTVGVTLVVFFVEIAQLSSCFWH